MKLGNKERNRAYCVINFYSKMKIVTYILIFTLALGIYAFTKTSFNSLEYTERLLLQRLECERVEPGQVDIFKVCSNLCSFDTSGE